MLSGCVAPVAIAGDNVSRSNCEKRAASDLLEALLLWALKRTTLAVVPKRPLNDLHLADLIDAAAH